MYRIMLAAIVTTCALGGQALAFEDKGGGKMRHGSIMQMDSDKSGDVDRGEFTAAFVERAMKRFEALDTDGDGMVSREEFTAMIADQSERRFAWLDRDRDGKLTRDDRRGRGEGKRWERGGRDGKFGHHRKGDERGHGRD